MLSKHSLIKYVGSGELMHPVGHRVSLITRDIGVGQRRQCREGRKSGGEGEGWSPRHGWPPRVPQPLGYPSPSLQFAREELRKRWSVRVVCNQIFAIGRQSIRRASPVLNPPGETGVCPETPVGQPPPGFLFLVGQSPPRYPQKEKDPKHATRGPEEPLNSHRRR
jgi:hypothetical protein